MMTRIFVVFNVFVMTAISVVWAQIEQAEYRQSIQTEIEGIQGHLQSRSDDPVVLTKLAGLYLQLGDIEREPQDQRIEAYEEGAKLAKQALTLQENIADAHFYYAANLGSASQLKGVMASALVVNELRGHATRAVELQADHAPALHMLGRMLDELPWFLGGDRDEALQYLHKALAVDEYYAHARLDLAKFYLERDDVSGAMAELGKVLQQPRDQQSWNWRHRYKPQAEKILRDLRDQNRSMMRGEEATE